MNIRNINYQRLARLLADFAKQENFRILGLSESNLKNFPKEIGLLKGLRQLYLIDNQLVEFPKEITELTNLETLYLHNNKIDNLPKEIRKLKNLKSLILSNNRLTEIPKEISYLINLEELSFYGNKIQKVPEDIGNLTNLKALTLSKNELINLPKEISQLTALEKLYLSGNKLISIPKELRQLSNLKKLDLKNNFLPIPLEILNADENPFNIINYYIEFIEAEKAENLKPLKEGKVIFIGQGNVGKTSLRKCLVDGQCNIDEPKTEGLEVILWNLEIGNNEFVKLNVWDFGGQELYHSTHKFFLKSRCIYILVVDIGERVEWRTNRIDYWLKTIENLTEDSFTEKKVPVLIVGTKGEKQIKSNTLNLPFDINEKQKKFPKIDIVGFYPVSSRNKGINIDIVKNALINELESINVFQKVAGTFFEDKERVENLTQNYITLNQFKEFCPENHEQRLFEFDRIGIITTFDKPGLYDLIVLKPKWITESIYKILSANYILDQTKGTANFQTIKTILNNKAVQDETIDDKEVKTIIELMKRFELCSVQTEGENEIYFFPIFFTVVKPSISLSEMELVHFVYKYNFLSDTLISRFLVKILRSPIYKFNCWRTGVYLEKRVDDEILKAIVEADLDEDFISIKVEAKQSKDRKIFLDELRSYFNDIHNNHFISIVEEEKISVPEHPSILLNVNDLLAHKKESNSEIIVPSLDGLFNVRYLLHEVPQNTILNISKPNEKDNIAVNDLMSELINEIDDSYIDFKIIETQIDKDAKNIVRLYVFIALLLYIIVQVVWFTIIIFIGWNTMEMFTYFFSSIPTILFYFYLALTLQEYNPLHFTDKLMERERKEIKDGYCVDLVKQDLRKERSNSIHNKFIELINRK